MKRLLPLVSIAAVAAFALGARALRPAPGLAASRPYLIGAVVCESGPAAPLGRPEADGIRLAVDEVNKAGGIAGHPLEAVVVDDASTPANAVNAVRRLLEQHVVAILGSSITPTAMAMVPLAQQAHVPMIAYASSAAVIDPVSERGWIFKIPPTDTAVAQTMQEFMKARGLKKVGAIYRNDDYGKIGIAHFSAAGKASGFEVVDSEAIDSTATDATTQLTKLRAADPQAILVWSTLPSVYAVAKSYRQLGMKEPLYFSDGAADLRFPQQAGSALDGAYVATTRLYVADHLPKSDPQRSIILHYIAAFESAYPEDKPANMFGGFAYDSVYWLEQALAKSGPDPAKLRDALEHVDFAGVTGVFRTSAQDHNGLPPDSDVVTKVVAGKFTIAR